MELKPFYTVAEIAELLRVDRQRAAGMLARLGVLDSRCGRIRIVWLSTIRERCPEVWESILDSQTYVETRGRTGKSARNST